MVIAVTSDREKILSRALKLKELAERGIDGEKETARRMFTEYKAKHNIQDYELSDNVKGFDAYKKYASYTHEELLRELFDMGLKYLLKYVIK